MVHPHGGGDFHLLGRGCGCGLCGGDDADNDISFDESMLLVITCCRLFWELEVSLAWPIRVVIEVLICWVEDVVVGYVAVIAIAHW